MARRGRNVFNTPASERWPKGKRSGSGSPPPPHDDHPAPQRQRSAVGVFSINHEGRVRPIADKRPQRRHWSRSPGIDAVTGKIYQSWEQAHDAKEE